MGEIKQITIHLEEIAYKKLKIAALVNGKTMKKMLTDLIMKEIKDYEVRQGVAGGNKSSKGSTANRS